MSLFDRDHPDHVERFERSCARWTPEKEAEFKRDVAAGKYQTKESGK